MKTISYTTFRENRAQFPLAELRKYDGQWVAFAPDGKSIIAGAVTIAELAEAIRTMNVQLGEVMFDHIVSESDDIHVGGAEFM